MGSTREDFITNALAPAKLKAFEIDEATKRVKIIVSEDQLSLATESVAKTRIDLPTGWQADVEPVG